LHALEFGAGAHEVEPDVEVRSGATARFDLDLVRPRGCAISGHIRFEGVELGGWSAVLSVAGTRGTPSVAGSSLGRDGSFRVVAPRPGAYELRIWGEQSAFVREVQLGETESTLELSFARAVVSVEPSPDQEQWLRLEGTCADGTRFEAWSWCETGSGAWRVNVPAGSYKVKRGREWSELVELAPGEERTFSLPSR
jgi:hypothetical protein